MSEELRETIAELIKESDEASYQIEKLKAERTDLKGDIERLIVALDNAQKDAEEYCKDAASWKIRTERLGNEIEDLKKSAHNSQKDAERHCEGSVYWRAEATRYCKNSNYWQDRTEVAEKKLEIVKRELDMRKLHSPGWVRELFNEITDTEPEPQKPKPDEPDWKMLGKPQNYSPIIAEITIAILWLKAKTEEQS